MNEELIKSRCKIIRDQGLCGHYDSSGQTVCILDQNHDGRIHEKYKVEPLEIANRLVRDFKGHPLWDYSDTVVIAREFIEQHEREKKLKDALAYTIAMVEDGFKTKEDPEILAEFKSLL